MYLEIVVRESDFLQNQLLNSQLTFCYHRWRKLHVEYLGLYYVPERGILPWAILCRALLFSHLLYQYEPGLLKLDNDFLYEAGDLQERTVQSRLLVMREESTPMFYWHLANVAYL